MGGGVQTSTVVIIFIGPCRCAQVCVRVTDLLGGEKTLYYRVPHLRVRRGYRTNIHSTSVASVRESVNKAI